MLRQAVTLMFLAVIASASYPKITVVFQDPLDYQAESKCCMGAFDTPHRYDGEYQVTALYLTSHVRNYVTLEIGPEVQDIRIKMSEWLAGADGWTVVGTGNYSQLADPVQLLRVPISYKTTPNATYLFEIIYYGSYTYPVYWYMDVSAGPYNTTYNSNPFIIGIEYEYL
ncbi:uncharacterized protein LOC124596410 [Schistocerca americana]|uniref:uncharacterized protein LOC124596410 n=1 Tax=Schistocerca americana TaxID=7009 RepID=UPI001F4FFEBD|nr:uncharacterized protein LOC124596410 [Schistocerca americana]